MFLRGLHDQRRVELLQYVTVLLQQQSEELPYIVANDIHFEAVDDARILDSLV